MPTLAQVPPIIPQRRLTTDNPQEVETWKEEAGNAMQVLPIAQLAPVHEVELWDRLKHSGKRENKKSEVRLLFGSMWSEVCSDCSWTSYLQSVEPVCSAPRFPREHYTCCAQRPWQNFGVTWRIVDFIQDFCWLRYWHNTWWDCIFIHSFTDWFIWHHAEWPSTGGVLYVAFEAVDTVGSGKMADPVKKESDLWGVYRETQCFLRTDCSLLLNLYDLRKHLISMFLFL